MLRSQTHAKHTARAINKFIAFIHCELSRSETRKRLDHKLIASTMCEQTKQTWWRDYAILCFRDQPERDQPFPFSYYL